MNKRLLSGFGTLLLLIGLFVGCSYEQTLVTVAEEQYTVADFKEIFTFIPTDDSTKRLDKIDEFINQMCCVAEARTRGYEDDPVIQTALQTHEKSIVYNGYYQAKVIDPITVTEAEVKERYEQIIDQVHLAQIVVEEESLAQYIQSELRKGVPFESLHHFSLDTVSEMGDIGFHSILSLPENILAEVERVEFGATTDAVKLGNYYYFLKVIERIKADEPQYDKIKEHIREAFKREKVKVAAEKFIDDLMAWAKIEYNQQGLDLLLKPDSLMTVQDLDMWVVKKYDTAFVRVRTIKDAVQYQYRQSFIDPRQLIERVLIPDIIYDRAVMENFDKTKIMKRKLNSALTSLIYQKFYSDEVLSQVSVDSSEVIDFFSAHKAEYPNKKIEDVFRLVESRIRTEKINRLRKELFARLREQYQPDINREAIARLLKEEA